MHTTMKHVLNFRWFSMNVRQIAADASLSILVVMVRRMVSSRTLNKELVDFGTHHFVHNAKKKSFLHDDNRKWCGVATRILKLQRCLPVCPQTFTHCRDLPTCNGLPTWSPAAIATPHVTLDQQKGKTPSNRMHYLVWRQHTCWMIYEQKHSQARTFPL